MLRGPTDLSSLGWTDERRSALAELADDSLHPARVAMEATDKHVVLTPESRTAQISGRLRHRASTREELPAVGD